MLAAIERDFGFVEACTQQLSNAVGTHFGSGWARLVFDSGTLKGLATHDAASTMAGGQVPLMTIDA
ncbi:MAG: Fe-Mn family superoxide dismutase [Pseudomonadota bacterium]|nr:Fe-Mn family superoxide dismutase [Pseudomonadota bacterium]